MSDAWLYAITYYCSFCLFEFLLVQVGAVMITTSTIMSTTQHLVEIEKENAAKKTELWSRVVFAVVPFLFFITYFLVALVGRHIIGKTKKFELSASGAWLQMGGVLQRRV